MLANKLLYPVNLIPYEDGMCDEFPARSLVHFDWRTADALVNATILALRDGSLKQVGILLTLDAEVLAS